MTSNTLKKKKKLLPLNALLPKGRRFRSWHLHQIWLNLLSLSLYECNLNLDQYLTSTPMKSFSGLFQKPIEIYKGVNSLASG